jgi:predicted glycosyltransferase involved in capsule biosynthesis
MGLKLRGGVFAIYKKDYLKVNGFDENFSQWGNEDDDLGRRLNNVNVVGINPFKKDYTVHLYHPQNSQGGRKNLDYNKLVKAKAKEGYYYCDYGINSPKDVTDRSTQLQGELIRRLKYLLEK